MSKLLTPKQKTGNNAVVSAKGSFLKMLTLCAVASTMLLLNASNVFAATGNWVLRGSCEGEDGPNQFCGECKYGGLTLKPRGKGIIDCWIEEKAIDLGMAIGTTDPTSSALQTTNVFFPKDPKKDSTIGVGYIGATVLYNQYAWEVDKYMDLYTTCDAIEIRDYNKWLEAARFIYNTDNYVERKALIYPNPTSSTAFVKLNDEYIAELNVQTVTYQLYNSDQTLLTTITTNDVRNVTEIPSDYIRYAGVYYVICNVINDEGQVDSFTLQLIVAGK